MKNKFEFKKLVAQIRLKQEQEKLEELRILKVKAMDRLTDKFSRRILLIGGMVLLSIWLYYKIQGLI